MNPPLIHHPELRGRLAAAAQAVLALTALTAVVAALLAARAAQWFMVGFEVVVVASAALGVLAARGRPPYGQPLAMACVGGAIAASSFLESIGIDRSFLGPFGSVLAALQGPGVTIKLDGLLVFRLLVGAALAALAGGLLIRRAPGQSARRLGLGLALCSASLASLAAAWAARGQIAAMPGPLKWAILVFGFIAVTGLIAAGAQQLIDAFSARRTMKDER